MDKTAPSLPTLFGLMNEINIIAQLSGNALERVMPDGMTMAQFGVLNHLIRLGGNRTPLSIANALQVSKGAMTNTLGHLQKRHAISVTPDPEDGRSKRIDVTEQGRSIHAATLAAIGPEVGFLARHLTETDLAAAMPVLSRIRALLDERRN